MSSGKDTSVAEPADAGGADFLQLVASGSKSAGELVEGLAGLSREELERSLELLIAAHQGVNSANVLLTREIAAQESRVASLLDVARTLNSAMSLRELIQSMLRKACELLDADRATLFLLDHGTGELCSKIVEGGEIQEIRFPKSAGIAGHVATSGELLNIRDAYASELFNPEFDRKTGYRTRTILCSPIRDTDGKITGVMQLINKRDGVFSRADEQFLEAFSSQAAVALENAELYENVLAQQRKVESLLKVANALSSQLDLNVLIDTIMGKACEILEADRATLFLIDRDTSELWSRALKGGEVQEIRFPRTVGIAGHVATTGEALNIEDAYASELFNPEFDKKTGYRTKTILCMPIRNSEGTIIGVTQIINKLRGRFTRDDEQLLGAFSAQAAIALENAQLYESVLQQRRKVESLLKVANSLTSELDLLALIQTIMGKASEMLGADRATLFLVDRETRELWSTAVQGAEIQEIRFPMTVGIAGHVATSGTVLNIPDAYESELFNPAFDKKTGYRTKTILCVPIRDKGGEVMGVVQMINKQRGTFDSDDEQLLGAFSAQAAIALQNAQLYENVLNLKNYLESILQNLSNGVLTVDERCRITVTNSAAHKILELPESLPDLVPLQEGLGECGTTLTDKFHKVLESGERIQEFDRDYVTAKGNTISMNVSIQQLRDQSSDRTLGGVAILEDMTREKRTRSMMTRLLSKDVAEQLLSGDWESLMKGHRLDVTILFSDIRSYTSLTEKLGATEIVLMLNEYFSYMVDAIFTYGGTLDKFIGDALMAIFGAPVHHPDNAAHAVHAALEMGARLKDYNASRVQKGKPPISIGIGLSSGEVLCGTIGSEKKMEYTAIGDGVNLASRLEGANKFYGTDTLISEFTYRKAASDCRVREIDLVKVKGKSEPVAIYQLLGLREASFDDRRESLLEAYAEGMRWVGAQQFAKARELFHRAVSIQPDDGPSKFWVRRTEELVANPPGPGWDGTFSLTEK